MTRIDAINTAFELFDKIKAYEDDEFTALMIAREMANYISVNCKNQDQSIFYLMVYFIIYQVIGKKGVEVKKYLKLSNLIMYMKKI